MKTSLKMKPSVLATVRSSFALAGLLATIALTAAEKPDYKTIAERIVGQSVNVKEGDRVVLRGDVRDLDLLEELSFAVWRRGAEPLQLVQREKSGRRYFNEVPAARDGAPLGFSLKLAELETVEISINGAEAPGLLTDVAPARVAATTKRGNDAANARLKRGVRLVDIGNGLYPTEATAKNYGLTKDQLATLFWNGINVDYTKLQATGAAVQSVFKKGKVARLTHPNGTDLTMRIEGREVGVSDGVISAEDIAKGPPHTQVWLPAGEVYVVPVIGSVEGKIVIDRVPFEGDELVGVTLTAKGGKLVAHTAKAGAGYERWKALYAAAPAAKNDFAYLDVGINPNVTVPAGSKLNTWVPAGTVSVGFGSNVWAGGTNTESWGFAASLNGCTLTIDGKTVVDAGKLKTP